jgi:hypothetical protein
MIDPCINITDLLIHTINYLIVNFAHPDRQIALHNKRKKLTFRDERKMQQIEVKYAKRNLRRNAGRVASHFFRRGIYNVYDNFMIIKTNETAILFSMLPRDT